MPERYVCCVYIFVENCPCRVQGGGNISREVCHVPPEFKIRLFLLLLCKFGRSRSKFSQADPRAISALSAPAMAIFSPFVSSFKSGNRGKKPIRLYDDVRVIVRGFGSRDFCAAKRSEHAPRRPEGFERGDAYRVAFYANFDLDRQTTACCCLSTFLLRHFSPHIGHDSRNRLVVERGTASRANRQRVVILINSHRESIYPSYLRARSA